MTGPRRSTTARTLREDDKAVAGVVGFVLIIAVAVTYLAYVARTDVPRWGADAERSWDGTVGDTLAKLDRSAATGLGSDATTTISLPPAPAPRSFDIPLVARTQAPTPTGSIALEPDCGGLRATHSANGTIISDVTDGAHGCLVFRAQGTYQPSYGYRSEFGGLLRVERDRAYVVAGPALTLREDTTGASPRDIVGVTFLELRGTASSAASGSAAIPIDLVPGAAQAESALTANAASANWTFTTPYPDAWAAWYTSQIQSARLDSNLNYACAGPTPACPDLAPNQMRVILGGPDASPTNADLELSLSYGRYDVTIR